MVSLDLNLFRIEPNRLPVRLNKPFRQRFTEYRQFLAEGCPGLFFRAVGPKQICQCTSFGTIARLTGKIGKCGLTSAAKATNRASVWQVQPKWSGQMEREPHHSRSIAFFALTRNFLRNYCMNRSNTWPGSYVAVAVKWQASSINNMQLEHQNDLPRISRNHW